MTVRHPIAIVLLALGASCSGIVAEEDFEGDINATTIAIVDVNVVPMDRNGTVPSQTVLIEGGRITEMGPAPTIAVPAGALRIKGTGKYLIPGLIDMHVHIRAADLDHYLKAGITSVRNTWGFEALPALIRDIDSNAIQGPRIFSLTAGFDGSPVMWPQTQLSDNPGAVATLVDRQFDLGYREVKVYNSLSRVAYDSIVAVAKRKGMTWAGHVPLAVGLARVLESGQRSIEHLGGYAAGGSLLEAQVAATVKAGAYNCPTIAIQMMFTPQRLTELRSTTAALHRGGARLLVGTDAGIGETQPGSSIFDELDHFVQAGLTPFDALLAATRTGAEYLGQAGAIGTVEVGKEADLVLLRANPLADIRAIRNINVVILNGRVLR